MRFWLTADAGWAADCGNIALPIADIQGFFPAGTALRRPPCREPDRV
jgi:hypothetical protein